MESTAKYVVDIGNSGARLVRLPVDFQSPLPTPLRINWRRETPSAASSIRFYASETSNWDELLSPIIHNTGTDSPKMSWWISSVHRASCESLVDYLGRFPECSVHIVTYRAIPLEMDVEFPSQVGIDRLLAAYAACKLVDQRPLLVIQAGSAVTVDLIRPASQSEVASESEVLGEINGRYSGGAILPGVPMMLRLLSSAADMLPEVAAAELIELPPIPGRNSQAAMWAGVSSCLVGGIQHLVRRYEEQLEGPIPIVLSGGDGPLLKPHLADTTLEIDHLVLQGLRFLAQSE